MKAGVISMGLEGSSTSFLRAEERSKHCERTFLWALWWGCVGKGLPKPKPLNSFLLSSSVFVAHLSKSCCVKDVIRKTGGRGHCSWASENSIACHCHNTRNIALQPKNIVQALEMCEKCPAVVYSSQVPPAALICRGPAWDICMWDHFYLTVIVVVCWNKNSSRS